MNQRVSHTIAHITHIHTRTHQCRGTHIRDALADAALKGICRNAALSKQQYQIKKREQKNENDETENYIIPKSILGFLFFEIPFLSFSSLALVPHSLFPLQRYRSMCFNKCLVWSFVQGPRQIIILLRCCYSLYLRVCDPIICIRYTVSYIHIYTWASINA